MTDFATRAPERPERLDPVRAFAPAVAMALAFLWLFQGTLRDMAARWQEDPTFSHGWIVAPAAVAIAWFKRDEWAGTPVRGHMAGLGIIGLGLASMLLGHWATVLFIPFLSMLIVLGGIIVFLGGWAWFRRLLFPYAFLFFMVPWPDLLIAKISVPLQLMTSAYSALMANTIGMDVLREGNNLAILGPDGKAKAAFEVAVACSGMRSLVALMCLSAGFAYFTPVALWKRWALFLVGLPMAFLANIFRVFAILCVGNWISPDLAAKAFHDWSSPVLFLLCTMGLMSVRNYMLRETETAPHMALATAEGPAVAVEDDDAF